MIIDIPNYDKLNISNIVFDMNGTIAENGVISNDVREKINTLKKTL